MKVALAIQRDAVCPRLDCAQRIILLHVHDSAEPYREVLDISGWPARGRAGRLARLGVEVVICGGLCGFDEAGFDASGIRLISGVAGPIEEVIRAVCSGTIERDHDYWKEMGWRTLRAHRVRRNDRFADRQQQSDAGTHARRRRRRP